MPRGDGTGPAGMGPMTGRAAGYCAGYSAPGFMNPIPGGGFGLGRGRGGFGRGLGLGFRGGRGRMGAMPPAWGAYYNAPPYPQPPVAGAGTAAPYYAPASGAPSHEQEAEMLKEQAQYLQDMLENVQQRINYLEQEGQKEQ